MAALPLCAIKQEVEIEIRWGTVPAGANFECFSMMYYLGAVERSIVANSEEKVATCSSFRCRKHRRRTT